MRRKTVTMSWSSGPEGNWFSEPRETRIPQSECIDYSHELPPKRPPNIVQGPFTPEMFGYEPRNPYELVLLEGGPLDGSRHRVYRTDSTCRPYALRDELPDDMPWKECTYFVTEYKRTDRRDERGRPIFEFVPEAQQTAPAADAVAATA
jgi:hypothetical protein